MRRTSGKQSCSRPCTARPDRLWPGHRKQFCGLGACYLEPRASQRPSWPLAALLFALYSHVRWGCLTLTFIYFHLTPEDSQTPGAAQRKRSLRP